MQWQWLVSVAPLGYHQGREALAPIRLSIYPSTPVRWCISPFCACSHPRRQAMGICDLGHYPSPFPPFPLLPLRLRTTSSIGSDNPHVLLLNMNAR